MKAKQLWTIQKREKTKASYTQRVCFRSVAPPSQLPVDVRNGLLGLFMLLSSAMEGGEVTQARSVCTGEPAL